MTVETASSSSRNRKRCVQTRARGRKLQGDEQEKVLFLLKCRSQVSAGPMSSCLNLIYLTLLQLQKTANTAAKDSLTSSEGVQTEDYQHLILPVTGSLWSEWL